MKGMMSRKIIYLAFHFISFLKTRILLAKLSKKNQPVVFIVTCGPSLDIVKKMPGLIKLLQENYTICIKQAYNEFKAQTDLHIINEIRLSKYEYDEPKPLILSVGKKEKSMKSDAHFPIIYRNQNSCLYLTNDYEGNSLYRKPYFRSWGVGIMYELALFLPQIVNCKKLIIIGFDMNSIGSYHFYDSQDDQNAENYDVGNTEVLQNKKTIPFLEAWLNSVGIQVALFSPLSELPFKNQLSSIDDLNNFIEDIHIET